MARPQIVEQNFFEFRAALQRATNSGTRIEPKEKERWKTWVREHKIQEAAFAKIASGKCEEVIPVIIEGPPPVLPPPDLEHLHFNDPLIYFVTPPAH